MACSPGITNITETERERCVQLSDVMPTSSQADTKQSQDELKEFYQVFEFIYAPICDIGF